MRYIKAYEDVNNKKQLLKSLFESIYALYKTAGINFIVKNGEGDGEIYYEVFIERGSGTIGKNVFELNLYIDEPKITYMSFKVFEKRVGDTEKFIETIMAKHKVYVAGETIFAYGIDINKIPEIIEDLSLENFEMYLNMNKYNL